jgi:hypothetical protein
MGEWMYRSTRPLYPRGNSYQYPSQMKLGRPRRLSGRLKILAPHPRLELRRLVVQPVASRYTDCAIPALKVKLSVLN